MSTVKLTIPYGKGNISELQQDLRKWRIRHYPFSRQVEGLEVIMYANPKADWILLKYGCA
jgi:hypothetical protein